MISYDEYVKFCKEYDWKKSPLRFGQAFCNKFNIKDNELFYTQDIDRAREIIYKRYLKFDD